MIEAALAMVECLKKEGITTVFGYPGAAICPFYDHLYQSSIKHILVRQEQNGGHAANGYARITGKPAVCIATSGPGSTNLITAIATAYADSIPLIAITGQVSTDQIGKDVFQEVDMTGSVEPFVKHSYLVKDASQLPKIFKEAFYIAGSGRKGPVLIDVPFDIQKVNIDFNYPDSVDIRAYKPSSKGNSMQIKRIVQAIKEAKKPLICAGGGVVASNSSKAIVDLAYKIHAPIVTTMMGLDIIDGNDPLNLGMIGMHGNKISNTAMHNCDVLLLIGARVGDRAVTAPNLVSKSTKIIHIDIDPAEIGKNIHVDIPLVGDIGIISRQMLDAIPELKHEEWVNSILETKKPIIYKEPKLGFVNPKQVLSLLSQKAKDDTILVADVGQNQIWCANHFKVKKGRLLVNGGMGTMGYSVPAAIGAKFANPNVDVIAVCGDGSFQMNFMELATIMQHDVNLKIIVMRNTYLGMVRELQEKNYNTHEVAVSLKGSPDFIKLAEAYNIKAIRINSMENIDSVLDEFIAYPEPIILECIVSSDESTM